MIFFVQNFKIFRQKFQIHIKNFKISWIFHYLVFGQIFGFSGHDQTKYFKPNIIWYLVFEIIWFFETGPNQIPKYK
jgi:hypothetical protein